MRSCGWGGWLSRKDIACHLDRQRQAALGQRPTRERGIKTGRTARHARIDPWPVDSDWRLPAVGAPCWQPKGTDEWQEVEALCLPSRIS